jgi:hypothetical protein
MLPVITRATLLSASPNDYPTPSGHLHTSGEILARNCDLLDVYLNPQHAAFSAFRSSMSEGSMPYMGSHPQSLEANPNPQHQDAAEEPFRDHSFVSSTSASSSRPSSFSTASSPLSHATRPTCRHCGRSFLTNTNRNRHMRDDCPKRAKVAGAGFQCRNVGCGKTSSRKDNRDKHERENCAKRQR